MSLDAIELQSFRHLLAAIPEEMGLVLMRSAFSPNIKERLDFSCALTAEDGAMAAQASHIPVHLGSVQITGQRLLAECPMEPGDVILVNDPWRGGTHLPDVTLFAPVFLNGSKRPALGVLNRAHHADIGGATPGSMGPAMDIHGEGFVIPPVKLLRAGEWQDDIAALLAANSRTPIERMGDLRAQWAALRLGQERVLELAERFGAKKLRAAVAALREHAARVTRSTLRDLKDGTWKAQTRLDIAGNPKLCVTVTKKRDRLTIDFAGTDPAIAAPFNANEAITLSAAFYVVRMLVQDDLPTNAGCLEPVTVIIPKGCLLDAPRPSPVAGGNVETSQRVVDLLLQACRGMAPDLIPASSQGTMNNLTVGGGDAAGKVYTFYETLGGGVGAGPNGPGESGLQTHMTNTLNTPVEALENSFPVKVLAYHLRDGSGGAGRHEGGDGLVRTIEVRTQAQVTVLAGRREDGPKGARGGKDGLPGRDRIRQKGRWQKLPPNGSVALDAGDAVRIETPGGGGFGRPRASKGS